MAKAKEGWNPRMHTDRNCGVCQRAICELKQLQRFKGTVKYTLEGAPGLNLAEAVLVGQRNKSKSPQRRPLVMSYDEFMVFSHGTIGRELDKTIELLSLGKKERARRLKILRTLRDKLHCL